MQYRSLEYLETWADMEMESQREGDLSKLPWEFGIGRAEVSNSGPWSPV